MLGINVFDFGAKGDGITDDTKAIQSAIDYLALRGGGKIFFPYTKSGYRVASKGIDKIDGKSVRAQLVIPKGDANIELEGEMPCRFLNSYMVRSLEDEKNGFSPTTFGSLKNDNTFIFSDWESPEVHNPTERPWSILAAPEGTIGKGKFSTFNFSIKNLEFRVPLNKDKMYPTQSCVNLQNVSRIHISDSQFCLNEQVGDTFLNKELQFNPCHTSGVIASGDQNDNNVLNNVAVQGFKYGFVLGEHVVANYLYVHNCEEGITFHDASHISTINHVVAQHNRVIVSTTTTELYGMEKGPCYVKIDTLDFESGIGKKPEISVLKYGVSDKENRLHGSLLWHKPCGKQEFPVDGASNFKTERF